MSFFSKICIKLIRFYQREISPGFPRRCKYHPTCSAYAVQSLQVHGFFKGLLLTIWRVLRCNPWSKGGVDRVPEKGAWPQKPLGYTELMQQWAEKGSETGKTAAWQDLADPTDSA